VRNRLRKAWVGVFARCYDLGFRRVEDRGLRDARRELIAPLAGRVLEVGAGTGLNLPHYPDAVTELVVTEPEEAMARQLEQKPEAARASVVRASADDLPFPDGHFDAVVCTLVLCTVPRPEAALAEIRRVLKPGGPFVFFEHVRSEDPKLARWQDRLNRPWRALNIGCNCNRATEATIRDAGLELTRLDRRRFDGAPKLASPVIVGSATAPGTTAPVDTFAP
jgi:ubiquinone/menaquinone biosynthesis C-methylase UbiE